MNVRKLRLQRGWTQSELAKYAGVSQSFVSIVESGSRKKDYGVLKLKKIANALGVTVDELIDNDLLDKTAK